MGHKQTKHTAPDSSQDESSSTTRFTIDLPDSLHKRIKVQATIEEERSMKALIVEAVEQYLSQKE
jgi:predicted transcriptional regulator